MLFYIFILSIITTSLPAMEPAEKKRKIQTTMPQKSATAHLEIELKLAIPDNQSYQEFYDWVEKKPYEFGVALQKESYFVGPDTECKDTGNGYKDAVNTLRIRSQNNQDFITLKKRNIDPQTNKTTSREELETYIEDGDVLKEILLKLGYKVLSFEKKRIYKPLTLDKNKFEVAFDEVTSGPLKGKKFIEVELKSEVNSVEEGNKQIIELLKKAGLTKIITYDRGYFQMLVNPKYNFGEEKDLTK